jgi:hypothetical protein
VSFTVTGGKATVTPGSVMTDAQGNASGALLPVAGALGADYLNASADIPGSATPVTARTAFTVSSVTTSLGAMAASPLTVSAYGASVLTVDVVGASAAAPVTVSFSSTCASAVSPKAVLSPASVVVTGGTTASTTYQDQGCATADRVSAVIAGTSQSAQVDLVVQPPVAQSLEFFAVSSSVIGIYGSGYPDTSIVSFKLKDQFGMKVSGADVSFALDVPNVAVLSYPSTKTDADGIAKVSVQAGNLPTPVRVKATTVTASGQLTTVSNALSINAGLPTQRGMSFSASTFNVDGWSRDGSESTLRVQLNDRFGNPVPDGTTINLVTEGASVIPASCQTLSGVCSVKFVSSNFRPANGRVTVVAFAQGEESFDDKNGDNIYTLGEPFDDLGEVFVNKNENVDVLTGKPVMDIGEYLAGQQVDGVWSGNTYVRTSLVMTLSDASRPPRLFGQDCVTPLAPLDFLMGSCRAQNRICIRDANAAADTSGANQTFDGNPIPAGSTLSVVTKANGAVVAIDNSPISSTTAPTLHTVTADLSDCATPLKAGGSVDLTIAMPNGQKYVYTIGTVR